MNPPTTKEEAIELFKQLVAQHGVIWTAGMSIPKEHWLRMSEAQKFLNNEDRSKALGLPS